MAPARHLCAAGCGVSPRRKGKPSSSDEDQHSRSYLQKILGLKGHLLHMVRQDELGFGCRDHLFRCDAWCRLNQGCTAIWKRDDCEISDDQINLSQRGERKRALFYNLGFAFSGMLHGYHDALCTRYQVHRPAHAWNHLAGYHPVREVSLRVYLQTPKHRHIDMAATNETEGDSAVERTCSRQSAHRIPGCIRERWMSHALFRYRTRAD